MPFPRKFLNEGEEVVVDLRPHWWFMAGPGALLVVSLVVLVAAAARSFDSWVIWGLAGIVVASLAWFTGRYARWATTNFVVTTDRLVYRRGVIAKRGIEIPLDRVNTIFSNQSIFERLVGTGDLTIESGGEQGRETFTQIPRPAEVQQEIYRQIEEEQRRRGHGAPAPASVDAIDQIERLDELRRRGVISESEFTEKKTKLLGQL
jgi:uncharacterized membrane protein YdbT with pleckstrin-like domain